jgi:hypothetical protein
MVHFVPVGLKAGKITILINASSDINFRCKDGKISWLTIIHQTVKLV